MAELETKAPETEVTEQTAAENEEQETNESTETARLRADMAKMKAALDKATKEAAENKRLLRSKQTAEEAEAEIRKEQQEAMEQELKELRKERAVANTSKKVFTFIQDETVATEIANSLYGAEDVDAALDAIAKAWIGREKKLRQEYGRVPAPGIGATDGPTITKAQLDAMTLKDRSEFAMNHPDEYNKLMGK